MAPGLELKASEQLNPDLTDSNFQLCDFAYQVCKFHCNSIKKNLLAIFGKQVETQIFGLRPNSNAIPGLKSGLHSGNGSML